VQKRAAELLHIKPTTLNEMIKRHNLLLPRERDRERRARDQDEHPTASAKPSPA
jgi:hypothetical protein